MNRPCLRPPFTVVAEPDAAHLNAGEDEPYTLPAGKKPVDIREIGIAKSGQSYVWYDDGKLSIGTATAEAAAEAGLRGLPLDVRPTGFLWPADVRFPWSAEECRAAVLGYQVRWTGGLDDFDNRLRSEWEMSDG